MNTLRTIVRDMLRVESFLTQKQIKLPWWLKQKFTNTNYRGGGTENNETEEETFLREIFEETGCRVKIIKKLGTVLEERSNMDLKQISAIFVSELIEDTKKLYPTKKEIDEGLTVKWMDIDEAISAVKKSYDEVLGDEYEEVYGAHFVILRDAKILEFFKQDFLGQDSAT